MHPLSGWRVGGDYIFMIVCRTSIFVCIYMYHVVYLPSFETRVSGRGVHRSTDWALAVKADAIIEFFHFRDTCMYMTHDTWHMTHVCTVHVHLATGVSSEHGYRCDDGSCHPASFECDGFADCDDEEDEESCDSTYARSLFKCKIYTTTRNIEAGQRFLIMVYLRKYNIWVWFIKIWLRSTGTCTSGWCICCHQGFVSPFALS